MPRLLTTKELSRKLLRVRASEQRDSAIRTTIRQIPPARVATYAQVAAAAGYPLYHRQVVQVLRKETAQSLPWQRVVGAGGKICTMLDHGLDQRLRLQQEGVEFRGSRVRMDLHQHIFQY